MSVSNFIYTEWALILLLIALVIFIRTTVHLNKRVAADMLAVIALTLSLTVIDYIETSLAQGETYTVWRSILTAFKYSITPFIIAFCVRIVVGIKRNLYIFILAVVNFAVCVSSVFTHSVFWFSEKNAFHRGDLWFVPFAVCAVYIAVAFFCMIRYSSRSASDYVAIGFLVVPTSLCLVLPFIWLEDFNRWFCTTIAICVFVFYVNILMQLTKKDPLTGLLNRQSYYFDLERFGSSVTAVVSLDLDGLKIKNDTEGHAAGDKFILTVAGCIMNAARAKQRVYRVGGDEFMIICWRTGEEELETLVSNVRANTVQNECGCSIGSCMRGEGMTVEDMIRVSDERMYAEKALHYGNRDA